MNVTTEIQPSDVYDKVEHLYAIVLWLARLIGILCALVVVQIVAKSLIFSRVLLLLRRVEALLALNEVHGLLNDKGVRELQRQTQEAAHSLSQTIVTVGQEVKKEVPPAVAAELAKPGDSGVLSR